MLLLWSWIIRRAAACHSWKVFRRIGFAVVRSSCAPEQAADWGPETVWIVCLRNVIPISSVLYPTGLWCDRCYSPGYQSNSLDLSRQALAVRYRVKLRALRVNWVLYFCWDARILLDLSQGAFLFCFDGTNICESIMRLHLQTRALETVGVCFHPFHLSPQLPLFSPSSNSPLSAEFLISKCTVWQG